MIDCQLGVNGGLLGIRVHCRNVRNVRSNRIDYYIVSVSVISTTEQRGWNIVIGCNNCCNDFCWSFPYNIAWLFNHAWLFNYSWLLCNPNNGEMVYGLVSM